MRWPLAGRQPGQRERSQHGVARGVEHEEGGLREGRGGDRIVLAVPAQRRLEVVRSRRPERAFEHDHACPIEADELEAQRGAVRPREDRGCAGRVGDDVALDLGHVTRERECGRAQQLEALRVRSTGQDQTDPSRQQYSSSHGAHSTAWCKRGAMQCLRGATLPSQRWPFTATRRRQTRDIPSRWTVQLLPPVSSPSLRRRTAVWKRAAGASRRRPP